MNDLRSFRDHVGHPVHRGTEVLGVDVGLARFAGLEPFYQHKLVGVVDAAGPLEEQVARLIAGRLGVSVGEGEPLVASGSCWRGCVTRRSQFVMATRSAIGQYGLTNAV